MFNTCTAGAEVSFIACDAGVWRCEQEMQLLGRECKELQRQTEEDADREVEDLKEK